MGKKGSWFSAIKRVFTHSSKEKLADGAEKKSSKERKKKGVGKLKHGDGHSFIPLFREPSSIEKILGEAEREIANYRPLTPPEQSKEPARATPPPPRTPTPPPPRNDILRESFTVKAPTPPRAVSPPRDVNPPTPPRVPSPPSQRAASPPKVATPANAVTPARAPSPRYVQRPRPETTLKDQHMCATKIQTAYRGYMVRRNFRALKGLVRLQNVVKGQSIKRQTANALKCMQLLVRVQTQIQSRRIQMLENQTLQRQVLYKNDKDIDAFGKWMDEHQDEWDDSTLTKEEIEARMQRKYDAIVRRERAMAYAYSHQPWKTTPRTAEALMGIRAGGYPYWWNWLEQRQAPPLTPPNPSQSPAVKSFHLTPTRPTSDFKASPLFGYDAFDTPTPRSSKSAIPSRNKLARTPPGRLQQKPSRSSAANSPFHGGTFRDDDSLTSCPPFSVPRYMSPTQSAKAKVRGGKDLFPDSPTSTIADESKRRMSFPFGQSKWNNKDTMSQKGSGKNVSVQSVGNMSVDSTTSMPTNIGRKPFNRFV